jgi:transposase InsO family protein
VSHGDTWLGHIIGRSELVAYVNWVTAAGLPPTAQLRVSPDGLNLTLDREWAYTRPYHSNKQRLDALPVWLHDYNHHRPHRALNGRSPMQLLNNLPGSHS